MCLSPHLVLIKKIQNLFFFSRMRNYFIICVHWSTRTLDRMTRTLAWWHQPKSWSLKVGRFLISYRLVSLIMSRSCLIRSMLVANVRKRMYWEEHLSTHATTCPGRTIGLRYSLGPNVLDEVSYQLCVPNVLDEVSYQLCVPNILDGISYQLCVPNVLDEVSYQLCVPYVLGEVSYQLCVPNVLDEVSYQLCVPNVLDKVSYQLCVPNVLNEVLFQLCVPNVLDEVSYQLCVPNVLDEVSYQLCVPNVLD